MPLAMHVRGFPPDEVTSRNADAEAEPGAGGLAQEDIDSIWKSVVRLYRTGLQPAIALCVRRRGVVVLDRAIGHLRGNSPGDAKDAARVPIRHDSLFNFFSASKAVTAMVIHLLDQRGVLHLDDAVVEYFPEFGKNGKEDVTLRQLLTHRAGIPNVTQARVDVELLSDPQRLLDILCDAKPLSVPGRRLAYHALTGGFVLGEVVRRITGRDIRRVLREDILGPLGFATFDYGVPAERVSEVAVNAFTGLPSFPPQSWALERALGLSAREATALSNDPRFLTAIVPSGNVIGTANEASRFFQLLLEEGSSTASACSSGARSGAPSASNRTWRSIRSWGCRCATAWASCSGRTTSRHMARTRREPSGTWGSPTSSRGPIRSGRSASG